MSSVEYLASIPFRTIIPEVGTQDGLCFADIRKPGALEDGGYQPFSNDAPPKRKINVLLKWPNTSNIPKGPHHTIDVSPSMTRTELAVEVIKCLRAHYSSPQHNYPFPKSAASFAVNNTILYSLDLKPDGTIWDPKLALRPVIIEVVS